MSVTHGASRFSLILVAVMLLISSRLAHGQAAVNLPPQAESTSPTGVNFKSGAFTTGDVVDLSIGGPGIAGLHLVRSYSSTSSPNISDITNGQGWTFNVIGLITRNKYVFPPDEDPPPNPNLIPWVYTVSTGTKTVEFKGNGSTPGRTRVGSETLTGSLVAGSTLTFTDSDGTAYLFPWSGGSGRLKTVIYPDGTTLDYTYQTSPSFNSVIKSIISNRGYALLSNGDTQMCVVNMAETYVTASSSCPAGAQTVTYTKTVSVPSYSAFIKNLTSVTNALGQVTNYAYVGADHLGCIKLPGQSTCLISNTYNVCSPPPGGSPPANLRWSDQVTSQTSGTGETYTYSYSYIGAYTYCSDYTGYGATTTMVAPGSATTVVYTNDVGIPAVSDPLGRFSSTGTYDEVTGNPGDSAVFFSQTAPEGNGEYVFRDARGNVTQTYRKAKTGSGVADQLLATASFPATCTNPKTCNQPDYTLDAKSNRTDFTYDPTHGGVTSVTLPAPTVGGVRPQKRFTYTQLYAWIKNSSGSFVQAASPVWVLTGTSECMTMSSCPGSADEIKTTITYGTTGTANNLQPTAITVAAGNNSVSATATTTYDSTGNVITVDGPQAGSDDTTRIRYDALRRAVGVVGPDPDGAGALLNRAVRTTYDIAGRLTKIERGTVNSQSDVDWTAFSPLEVRESDYDAMGRALNSKTSSGGTTFTRSQFSYDASGRLDCAALRMDPAQWNSQTNACVPQTSGPNGPDRISKNIYNIASERTKIRLGVGTSIEADEATFTFTDNGRLSTITDGEGNKTSYTYDAVDRLYRTNFPDASVDGLSDPTVYEQLTYDASDNTTQRRLRDGKLINFTYDGLNRILLKDLPSPEIDVTYNEYDLQGHLTSVSKDFNMSASWDALGRKRVEVGPLGTMTYDYDSAGRRTKTTWPDGFYSTQDHYTTNEVRYINEFDSGVAALYQFDNLGNRVGLYRSNGTSTVYARDQISRLTSFTNDLGGTNYDSTTTFTYNPANQIATLTRDNDSYAWLGHYNRSDTSTINGLNQVTSVGGKSLGYDGRGNVASYGSDVYTYSSENLLVTGPGGATLQYDPYGRLYQVSKAGVVTRFQYDGVDLVTEYDGTNSVQRRYLHGPGVDEPMLWYEGSGTGSRNYYHYDERGSVVAISDGVATTFAVKTYDEYGVPGGSAVGRFSYTGQTWLSEVGMYYYKARMYSPTLGRFMQTDPIGYAAGTNIYAYVVGDPVNLSDSLGLDGYGETYPQQRYWRYGNDGFLRRTTTNRYHYLLVQSMEKSNRQLLKNQMSAAGAAILVAKGSKDCVGPQFIPCEVVTVAAVGLILAVVSHSGGSKESPPMAGASESATGGPDDDESGSDGASTEVKDTTDRGAKETNLSANLTPQQFQSNLINNGYRVAKVTQGPNGSATILSNGQKTYTIYTATSTGGPTAQATNAAGDIIAKIRLLPPP